MYDSNVCAQLCKRPPASFPSRHKLLTRRLRLPPRHPSPAEGCETLRLGILECEGGDDYVYACAYAYSSPASYT